jgi:hypothetical protein
MAKKSIDKKEKIDNIEPKKVETKKPTPKKKQKRVIKNPYPYPITMFVGGKAITIPANKSVTV